VKVRIRLFAQQRQLTGWREQTIELAEGSTVSTAWDALVAGWPVLAPGTDSVRFARNAVYADGDEPLSDGDEVAVIPPVAGGALAVRDAIDGDVRAVAEAADKWMVEVRAPAPSSGNAATTS
jgi:molybdopterin synthase catalytic subunit